MALRTALVLGASGLVGSRLLQALLNDPVYGKITILTRKSLTIKSPKLQEHIVDFDRLMNSAHLLKTDDVFCCLGTTIRDAGSQKAFYKVDFTYPFECARIAAENGVKNFLIVTSIGANVNSKAFYTRVKGDIEKALGTLGFASLHIFRPSFLTGPRKERRIGEMLAIPLFYILTSLLFGSFKKYRPIRADAVARAMVGMAITERPGVLIYESNMIQMIADELKRQNGSSSKQAG